MAFAWAFLLAVVLFAAWVLTLLGMPGNWLMVAAVVVYVLLMPAASPVAVGWGVVVGLIVLAGLGELMEFLAGAAGASRAGASRRGVLLALVGSLVGAVLFAGLGAFAGAVLGEQWKGRDLDESLRVGNAAFWGRLLGTVAKTAVGAAMVAVTLVALVID